MEERIAVLEQDVNAIKSELAVIRSTCWMREDGKALDNRVSHIAFELGDIKADIALMKADIAQLKLDVAQLKSDVAQLKSDVAQLKADVATLKMDLAALKLRFDSELPHMATKVDLYKLEARMKAWGIGLALSVITANTGVNFAMYSSLKSQLPAHAAVQGGQPPLALAAAAAKPWPYFLPGW